MQMDMLQCSMIFLLKNVSTQKKKLGKAQPSGDPNCGDFARGKPPVPEHSVVGYTVVKVDGATKGSDL